MTDETVVETETTPNADATADQPTEAQTSTDAEQEEKPVERTFTQAELDAIVQKSKAKAARKARREAELELENRYLKQQPPTQPTSQGEPKQDDYEDYGQFVKDLAVYQARQAFEAQQREAQQRQASEQQQRSREEARQRLLRQAANKYDDFEEVAFDGNLPVSDTMAQAIGDSEMGADLLYYLGSNPDEADRIFNLPPARQMREIIKLESTLSATPKPTGTPPPIKPSGNAAKVEVPITEVDSMADFLKRRRETIRNRR